MNKLITKTLTLLNIFVCGGLFATADNAPIFNEIAAIQKDYDRSILDDYVAFNLYSLDRQHEYFLGSAYRNYTLMHVTPEVAASQVSQQIASLRNAIQKSYHSLAVDESLRRQITSLAESLKILPNLSGGMTPELRSVQDYGMRTLTQAFARYQEIKAQVRTSISVGFNKGHSKEAVLMGQLSQLAGQQEQIEAYAAEFEHEIHAQAWTKRKAACGATARAIVYYFKEKGLLIDNMVESFNRPIRGINSLIFHLEKNKNIHGHGFLYFTDTAKLDHAFVIQQTSEGRYRILQSFIDEYTLAADLAQDGQDMSYEEMMQFVYKLKDLLSASQWDEHIANLYEELFLTLPKEGLHQEFNEKPSDLSFVELPYRL